MSTSEGNTTKCKFAKEEEEGWGECGENVPESRTKHELYMFQGKSKMLQGFTEQSNNERRLFVSQQKYRASPNAKALGEMKVVP